MIKNTLVLLLVFMSLIVSGCGSPGEKLLAQARGLEERTEYFLAFDAYLKAVGQLRKEGNTAKIDECRYALTRTEKITLTYNLSKEAAVKMIKQAFPGTTDLRIGELIKEGRLPHLRIGGRVYYFTGFLNTLAHLYPDFRSKQTATALGKSANFFKIMSRYIYEKEDLKPGQTLTHPIRYLAKAQARIPWKLLPQKGLLKVWVPLPLVTAAQQNIEILDLYPRKYVKYPIKQDGDIGLVYFEIPLQEIKADLLIGLDLKFTHFEERVKVDPAKIGRYDLNSDLYNKYTAPGGNIALTPMIRATAKKLAGNERNPYRIAKIFFDHIVWDLDYSYTPHPALEVLNIPESVYVHEHGYGDCGAQSMYFAALCRSVGIPARAPGGMQLFPISQTGCGDHFWAQFYLPNYGWVPVDTSAGQLAKYIPALTKKQQRDFADYYFAGMDPFRYLIQQDVDIPFIPAPDGPLAFGMVLQEPTAVCAEMDRNPGLLFMDNWKMTVKPY